jgi:hypothetical protein
MNRSLHIVTLDVPFPADYGGAIDMYTRIIALKEAGFTIHLHCFEYGRGEMPDEIARILADHVFYYKRKTGVFSQISSKPYIVKSRENQELQARLLADNWPVLLEGQHCSVFAKSLQDAGKRVLVRMHNIEWHYYTNLAKSSTRILERFYYRTEAKKLQRDEQFLLGIPLACISKNDAEHYRSMGFNAHWLPPVLQDEQHAGDLQDYCLFHGNLSVPENEEAVRLILAENARNTFSEKVVIAGKNPSESLKKQVLEAGFELIANPDGAMMSELISHAKVHLLITKKVSGIKLKLLQSLATNGTCIATVEMLANTGLNDLCIVWDERESLAELCSKQIVNLSAIATRKMTLNAVFGAENYVNKIEALLFP